MGVYYVSILVDLPFNTFSSSFKDSNSSLDLSKSSKAFSKSKIMRELFGDEWVDHFTLTRQWENKCYNEQKRGAPDWHWMLDRYFEII